MTEKVLAAANTIAFLVMVFINYLSNTGIFAGNTMADISTKYDNLFTPAGYAFSIWGLIYLALLGFVVYQGKVFTRNAAEEEKEVLSIISWWFVVSCIANCLWIVSWLNDYIGVSVLVMAVLLISLFRVVVNTRMELSSASRRKKLLVWLPFSLYSGWVSVAFIANIAAYLTKANWNGFGISQLSWTLIMIIIAGLLHLLITWARNMREFALVGAWALVAIGIANRQQEELIVMSSFAIAGILILSSVIHALKYLNLHSNTPNK